VIGVLLLPSGLFGKRIYVSENALQPAQVNVYWGWNEVHHFNDLYDELINRFPPGSEREDDLARAEWVRDHFKKRGLDSEIQSWNDSGQTRYNTYGILLATRAEGTEAVVVNAPWSSKRQDGGEYAVNAGGIALMILMAEYASREFVSYLLPRSKR